MNLDSDQWDLSEQIIVLRARLGNVTNCDANILILDQMGRYGSACYVPYKQKYGESANERYWFLYFLRSMPLLAHGKS